MRSGCALEPWSGLLGEAPVRAQNPSKMPRLEISSSRLPGPILPYTHEQKDSLTARIRELFLNLNRVSSAFKEPR